MHSQLTSGNPLCVFGAVASIYLTVWSAGELLGPRAGASAVAGTADGGISTPYPISRSLRKFAKSLEGEIREGFARVGDE